MDVPLLFAGLGAIILVGFLGSLLFDRTKIPDILILIFIGLIIGPILSEYGFGLLNDPDISGALSTIAPYFAALALVIILFDGGLNLNLEKTMQKLGVAILHTAIAFMGTMFVTALVCYYFFGITDIVIGLLLGCVLGGVSSAVVIPIMAGVSAKEDTRIMLTVESVLTDVLCIVTALILIEILVGAGTNTGELIQHLLSAFVLAGFIGFLFGVLWLSILKRLEGKPFAFMITIAALLLLYAVVEFIQVSGAIAALVFGLVLSNKDEIARILKIKTGFVFDQNIKQFHSEVSFLVRTFFFVYLGLTFTFSLGATTYSPQFYIPEVITDNPLLFFFLVLMLIFFGILIIRWIAASVSCAVDDKLKPDKSFITAMLPRGLAAAVIAALPFTIPEFTASLDQYGNPLPMAQWTPYYIDMYPHEALFLNMAFMMIVLTVIATTIGVSVIESSRRKAQEEAAATSTPADEWAQKSRVYKKHMEAKEGRGTQWTMKPKIIRARREEKSKPKPKVVRAEKTAKAPPPPARAPSRTSPPAKSSTKPPKPTKVAPPKPKKPARKDHPLIRRAEKAKAQPPKPKKKGQK